MKKVLLVEDMLTYSIAIEHLLSNKGFVVESVFDLPVSPDDQFFQDLLKRANEFCCIIWDGNIRKKKTSDGFIQAFAKVFKGPMLTFSSDQDLCQKQMDAGCTHNTGKNLEGVVACIVLLREEGKLDRHVF